MKSVTREEFRTWEKADPYWHGRWPYIEVAIALVKAVTEPGLIADPILEIGARGRKLFRNSSSMDIEGPATYVHDAAEPWPIMANGWQITTVLGLQVWEHLGDRRSGRQEMAFSQVRRVAKNAVLSFPLNWKHGDELHREITREDIARWTLGIEPAAEVHVRNRLVCLWRF